MLYFVLFGKVHSCSQMYFLVLENAFWFSKMLFSSQKYILTHQKALLCLVKSAVLVLEIAYLVTDRQYSCPTLTNPF